MAAPTELDLCEVTGSVFSGEFPVDCASVVFDLDCPPDPLPGFEIARSGPCTYTDRNGNWSIKLVRGARYVMNLRQAGICNQEIEVPDEDTATLQSILNP